MNSLALRAVLAIALLVMFVALSLALIVVLSVLGVWIFATFIGQGTLVAMVGAACLVSAGVIAWSLLPRFDRFEPPGPELTASDHPHLFDEIKRIGAATGQRPPRHVYLLLDANAFVAERGGILGIGSKRVMGIGLPLLASLSVSQLRAIIAHELGHFHGGDTRLGPWIYKTRIALLRTINNLTTGDIGTDVAGAKALGQVGASSLEIVTKPFVWFGALFFRITHAISRAQEYAADALAAETTGSAPLVEALTAVGTSSRLFFAYFNAEVAPILRHGCRVPLIPGFIAFVGHEKADLLLDDMTSEPASPYDSHPPLRDRVAAIEAIGNPAIDLDARPALDLLGDLETVEERLFNHLTNGAELPLVAWNDLVDVVHEPDWRNVVQRSAIVLAGLTPIDVPAEPADLRDLFRREFDDDVDLIDPAPLLGLAIRRFGSALAVLLIDAGFTVDVEMHEPIRLRRGEVVVEPWTLTTDYMTGNLDPPTWRDRWRALGVGELPLSGA